MPGLSPRPRSVADQVRRILADARPVAPLDVVLSDAAGCVLAQDLVASGDVPRHDVAAWDGYAVRVAELGEALPVVDDVPVTATGPVRLVPGTAVLVAAGAPVPEGADAVVPLASTDGGRAKVEVSGAVVGGSGVRPRGGEMAAGTVLLRAGIRLASRHLAAATGSSRVWVHPRPRVVVITVGDELVEPGREAPGAVPDANGHALAVGAREAGASAVRVGPVSDDRSALRELVSDQLVRADVLVVTGGSGGGPGDVVADVLAPMGVEFTGVGLRPGGRLGFGPVLAADVAGPERTVPVLALPGEPVAAMCAFEMFVRPLLRTMAGHSERFRRTLRAALAVSWTGTAGVQELVPVTLNGTGPYTARPAGTGLAALARADALAVVPADVSACSRSDELDCLVLD